MPFIGYGINSVAYRAAGSSAYDALRAQVQKRLSHGVQFGISYTWSHSLDEQSGLGLFYNGSNPLDLRSGYGNSDFDRTNVTTFNYVWQIPDFIHSHSILARAVNGFALEGITVFQSGQAYSVEDYSGAVGSQYYSFNDGITNPIIPIAPGVRPSQALTGHIGAFQDSSGNAIPALNASAFIIPFVNPGQNGVPACGLSTGGNQCAILRDRFWSSGPAQYLPSILPKARRCFGGESLSDERPDRNAVPAGSLQHLEHTELRYPEQFNLDGVQCQLPERLRSNTFDDSKPSNRLQHSEQRHERERGQRARCGAANHR